MSLKLLVLDMDDTLYLERCYVRSGFAEVGNALSESAGIDGFFELAWSLFEAGRRGDIFDVTLKSLGAENKASVDELVDQYRSHKPRISLCTDALDFIKGVFGKVPLALLTDGPPVSQRNKISALGIEPFFDEMVVTGEHPESWRKPYSDGFRHLERKFMVSGTECIYIADNPQKDFISPEALGWNTLRIRRPDSLHVAIESNVTEITSLPDADWLLSNVGEA